MRRRLSPEPPEPPEPPRCEVCEDIIDGVNEATEQGVSLCDDHATEEQIEWFLENKREQSGISCAVCGRPLLKSEAERVNSNTHLCENHDRDALQAKHNHDTEARRERRG